MSKIDRHTGSSFDSFLEEEGTLDEIEAVAAKRVIAWQLAQEMKQQHITKYAMAAALHTSRSQIDRLLDPENASVHLTTLARAAHAVGMRIKIGLERITVDEDASTVDAQSHDVARRHHARTKREMQHA